MRTIGGLFLAGAVAAYVTTVLRALIAGILLSTSDLFDILMTAVVLGVFGLTYGIPGAVLFLAGTIWVAGKIKHSSAAYVAAGASAGMAHSLFFLLGPDNPSFALLGGLVSVEDVVGGSASMALNVCAAMVAGLLAGFTYARFLRVG